MGAPEIFEKKTLTNEINWEINDSQWENNRNDNEELSNEQHFGATQMETTTHLICLRVS